MNWTFQLGDRRRETVSSQELFRPQARWRKGLVEAADYRVFDDGGQAWGLRVGTYVVRERDRAERALFVSTVEGRIDPIFSYARASEVNSLVVSESGATQ